MTRDRRRRGVAGLGVAVVAALVTMLLPASMGTAHAKPPPKPGAVSGLDLSAAKPNDVYRVKATWNAATNATGYRVTLSTLAGATLDQGTVSDTDFTGTAAAELVNTSVRVQVVPLNGTRRGKAASKTVALPDLTAPHASYTPQSQSSLDGNVTLTQESLSDDVSNPASITQSVAWGDGATSADAGTATTFTHTYPTDKVVYHPVVTVTDAAGNSRHYTLTIVVGDYTAPTGAYSAAPVKAWARWTRVGLTEQSLSDDLSENANITRVVDWGDGRTSNWTSGTTLRHRYQAAGTYTPTVTIADEAGNAAPVVSTTSVTVKVDAIAPGLRLTLPKVRKASVRSWTTLKGWSRDYQTGVRSVRVRAIEKRGAVWYAYKPGRQVWVRGGATKAQAWSKATIAKVSTTPTHIWSVKLRKLTKGTLVYRVSAVDRVNNTTTWRTHRQALTRR